MSDVAPFVKICVLGASGAGKTALLERLADGDFPQEASCTTKPFSKLASIANTHQENAASSTSPKLLQVKFVECPSGFTDDKSLASVMAEAFCTLLVYDVTDRASFDEAMRRWYPVANGLSPESFKMIVGCKVDAISERVKGPADALCTPVASATAAARPAAFQPSVSAAICTWPRVADGICTPMGAFT